MSEVYSHVVASRDGLFLVGHQAWRRLTPGLFFGVTLQGGRIYCFEAGDKPWVRSNQGRIVRFTLDQGEISNREVLVEGLDNGGHQLDFFDGSAFLVDTYNQQILEFDPDWKLIATHRPLGTARYGEWEEGYAHINSFLGRGDALYLLLHHGGKVRPSEVLQLDRSFREQSRFTLPGMGCHDLVRLDDGEWLVCDSVRGGLISANGPVVQVDALLTRGLSVGDDEIAVGSSLFGARAHRNLIPGFVTFYDRAYSRLARLHLPAAPTQIRRLEGRDLSFSDPQRRGARIVDV